MVQGRKGGGGGGSEAGLTQGQTAGPESLRGQISLDLKAIPAPFDRFDRFDRFEKRLRSWRV